MKLENVLELDFFNYYAICYLENKGILAPLQVEIDRAERVLRAWFKCKIKKLLQGQIRERRP